MKKYDQELNRLRKSRNLPVKKASKFLFLLNYKQLNKEVSQMGSFLSTSQYITSVAIIFIGVLLSSYMFKLELVYQVVLFGFSLICLPIIIITRARYKHAYYRFQQVATYLEEMVLLFKHTPKIITALTQLDAIFEDGIIKEIRKAKEHILNSENEKGNTYEQGLQIIEQSYPCSRIRSLHALMITIENQNSVDYEKSLDNLYIDISSWITRTSNYYIDLQNTKTQFNILILLTLSVTLIMVNILPKSLITFIDSPIYQISTLLLLMSMLVMFVVVQLKLNGAWLISDIDKKDLRIIRDIQFVEKYDAEKEKKKSIIKAIIGSVVFILGLVTDNQKTMILGIVLVGCLYFYSDFNYRHHYKNIRNELKKSFPLWLRDISLSMHNLVLTRAIRESVVNAPVVMQHYLRDFIEEIEADPTTILPYDHFLKDFNISEISSVMKGLYAISLSDSKNDDSFMISDLITRNQSMLETSEKIKNENAMAGINMIGMMPMLMGSFKLMVDMILMILNFLSMSQFNL